MDSKVNKIQEIIKASNKGHLNDYSSSKDLPSTELLIQFLASVMTKDYGLALKYCSEILNREPNNLTAREFYPLIMEKLEMIQNEEVESTSSESSLSSSSSSSSSEKNLFHNGILFTASQNEWGDISVEKINDNTRSNTNALEIETPNDHSKYTESSISLQAKPKNILLPTSESNKTSSPSNLLIHPTQTTTIIDDKVSNTEKKVPNGPKQEEKEAKLSQKQPSKILLRETRTVTLKKRLSLPNSRRNGNPQ